MPMANLRRNRKSPMRQIIDNYNLVADIPTPTLRPLGGSVSPKPVIFHILADNSQPVEVLDIGFGTGHLGATVKANPATSHWSVDGIDGWETNCLNKELFSKNLYRNVWHGLAQDLPSEKIASYKIICLLDVIEHLNAETAKWLFRTLLSCMGDDSYLFVSTPLWFYPQDQQQDGDLEEHLIGIPASSMLSLVPIMYSINHPLVGGFVYKKRSLKYIDFFQPSSDKGFSYEMGMNVLRALNINAQPGILYNTGL
jgi:2-polyprenyl-3-methyl-5-hydroxy-6-metoxy-1,4-benzoquinol methylase